MRTLSMSALLLCATVTLPGCIFAIGTDGNDWEDDYEYECCELECCGECAQMEKVEHRLALMERHLKGQCKDNCPLCKAKAAPAEAPAAPATEAKPAAK